MASQTTTSPTVNARDANVQVTTTDNDHTVNGDSQHQTCGPEKFDKNSQQVEENNFINMASQQSSSTSPTSADEVMTNNQTNITVKTNNGTDLTATVTDTPATHYDCGKPKWRYASGATEVTVGHPDNMLPKTALEKTGESAEVHDPKNTDDLTSGNYNTDGTFRGWTAINKANNKRQSKIICHHCKTLVCDGSLSKHQRSAKCVNADGRRFQVGVDPTKINADGTVVMGRMRRGDAPVKKTFACDQDGFVTRPLDWAGAEAHFAQLPRDTLAKMLVGQLAHINSDVTSHDIGFNFADDVLAPADYKPSTHGQRSQMATELATTHDKFTAWESTLEADKKLLQARALAMMTNGDFDATKLIMEEQTKLAALGATYNAKMADLEAKLADMDATLACVDVAAAVPPLQSYNVATDTPVGRVTTVKPRKKRAPVKKTVKKPVAPTADPVSDSDTVAYASDPDRREESDESDAESEGEHTIIITPAPTPVKKKKRGPPKKKKSTATTE